MRRAAWITSSLTAVATAALLFFGASSWCLGLWLGALWGLANAWCLVQAIDCMIRGQRKERLVGWLVLKFVGLYGGLGWLLLTRHLSPVGWLIGFTVSLIGLGLSTFPALGSVARKTYPLLLVAFGIFSQSLVEASEEDAMQASHAAAPEIPNLITLITHGHHGPVTHFLHTWENAIFAFIIVGIVGTIVALGTRTLALIPGRGQVALEAIVEWLETLVCGVLGKREGRRYLPFLGTLFLFIVSMNLAGLIPGLKSPTSRFEMTGAIALCVFLFVQWTGIRRMGIVGYVDHLIGQPRDPVGWILSPLMLFIHGIGELVKPLSLGLRLFGNIMGEDTLLGVFVTLGALMMAWSHLPIGIPLHLPFVLLAIIFSVVQALVFTMLSMVYISMMVPHENHEAGKQSGFVSPHESHEEYKQKE